jgi:hypothetical protein
MQCCLVLTKLGKCGMVMKVLFPMTMKQFIVTCSLYRGSNGVDRFVVARGNELVPALCDWSIRERCAWKCDSIAYANYLIDLTKNVHPNTFDFSIIEL